MRLVSMFGSSTCECPTRLIADQAVPTTEPVMYVTSTSRQYPAARSPNKLWP